MASHTPLKVNEPTAAYIDAAAKWAMSDTLMGGTRAMRDAGESYLPREQAEEATAYAARRDRSFLFGAYGDAVRSLGSRPFREVVGLTEATESVLFEFSEDVTSRNDSISSFAKRVFVDGVNRGLSHILVDFPVVPENESGEPLSLDDEGELGIRPFWSHVPATRIIGWRSERFQGQEVLIQLRIVETVSEPHGDWGEVFTDRVKVYHRRLPDPAAEDDKGETWWELWTRPTATTTGNQQGGEYKFKERGTVSINVIPLVTFYTNHIDFMLGSPPMADLAWKNLEHWQSSSDQRHILKFARMPLLFGAGFTKKELGDKVTIGPNQMIRSVKDNAKLGYVEHTGKAIASGRDDLEDIEDQMTLLGLKPLLRNKSGTMTATEKSIDTAAETSQLASWIRAMESALEGALGLTLMWLDRPDGEVGVNIDDSFAESATTKDELAELSRMRAMRDISRETYYEELKRRNLLSEEFDAEKEAERLAKEAATEIGLRPEPGEGEGEGEE